MNIEKYTALKYGSLFGWQLPTLYTIKEICEHYKVPYTAELEKKGFSYQYILKQRIQIIMDETIQSENNDSFETCRLSKIFDDEKETKTKKSFIDQALKNLKQDNDSRKDLWLVKQKNNNTLTLLNMTKIIANKKKQPAYVSVAKHYKHK